jgi:transcription-repair coupling factor (superfamily II helicase)
MAAELSAVLKDPSLRNISLKGLKGSGVAMLTAAIFNKDKGTYVCILNDVDEAGYFYNDLMQLAGGEERGGGNIYFFPSAYHRAIKYGRTDPASEILRTEALSALQDKERPLVLVTCPGAVAEKVISGQTLKDRTLKIHRGERLDITFVSDLLHEHGFERVDYVYEPGQYASRGSILDVFSFSYEYPCRIDFSGDEVDTIRAFDVETQLSREKFESVRIVPGTATQDTADSSLLDSLQPHTIIAARDIDWCRERIDAIWNDQPVTGAGVEELPFDGDISLMRRHLITGEDFMRKAATFRRINFGRQPDRESDAAVGFLTDVQHIYHKNFDLVSESFRKYISDGYAIYILSDVEKQAARIRAIFEDRNETISFTPVNKTLHEGFTDHTLRACFFTDHQIFDRFHKFNLRSDRARSGKISLSLKELNQFTPGDYVVHIDHGIGQFGGLVRTQVNGKTQEAVKLIYQNSDILFVSIHSLHKLSKYKGKDSGLAPKLNKLGAGAWERVKEKTKTKMKDIARDLIILYSKRRQEKGFAFSPDSFMQSELEASFIYEDTPDQMKATSEVKADMEAPRPMDRLICGDVGFGKTEIAIRAAFKAVADNKQVALLVPTTPLAFQHYKTFAERLKDFPCKTGYISRARTAAQIKDTLRQTREGEIDILIGTHRLTSRDVTFKDLGLLIIDEEQKFGVSVKEKLRSMKSSVDTLTMTATPIPRTLQFSLMGARDLSNLATPPPNRHPVQTDLERFSPEIIRQAINFELDRSGQVFFINNFIQNIPEIETLIRRETPQARICVGHGQMEPRELEKTLLDFVNYEYDVLIATSIIENGIDISNANTIIINNAHLFGLSDLHQLRGRVGRSNRKAFCYLLSPPFSTLTKEARRRLEAVENFASLGSGIHIAMQDLDIRGAGDLVGAEQSGFIAKVGYEAYQKILEEAVDELKASEFSHLYNGATDPSCTSDTTDVDGRESTGPSYSEGGSTDAVPTGKSYVRETYIESDLSPMLPPAYVPNDSERISLYRELDKMDNERQAADFASRLRDRFGALPQEAVELILIVSLRRMARELGIEKITLKAGRMSIGLVRDPGSPYYESPAFGKLLAFIKYHPRRCILREQNCKRSILIKDVPTIKTACNLFEEMSPVLPARTKWEEL